MKFTFINTTFHVFWMQKSYCEYEWKRAIDGGCEIVKMMPLFLEIKVRLQCCREIKESDKPMFQRNFEKK